MNYWHMQLHPNNVDWGNEIPLLKEKLVIGLGDWEKGFSQIKQFEDEMKIGDIVLIRRGSTVLALVKIISDATRLKHANHDNLDWFELRRKIEILDVAETFTNNFPQTRATLQKARDKNTPSYKYIENWYKNTIDNQDTSKETLKIKKIYIDNFKMFNNLNISFDKNNKPLPIIILAGVNGAGKTNLLEYIYNITNILQTEDKSYIKLEIYNKEKKKKNIETINFENITSTYIIGGDLQKNTSDIKKTYEKNIIYLRTDAHQQISSFESDITKYLKKLVWEDKMQLDEAYLKIKNFISNIFVDLNLGIEFDSLDRDEKIYFKNKIGKKFHIDEISTGEKTLLSKILSLFIKNYKNKIILIDEPELSLHPSWQNKILSIYEKFAKHCNCQIIIATHSPHIIGSAKPEYLKLLSINKDKSISIINGIEYSYGLEVDKVLLDIMGLEHKRTPQVAKKITKLWEFLEEEDYKSDKFRKLHDELEKILGSLDEDLVLARLEIANIKARNA